MAARICEEGGRGKGMLFPISDGEWEWNEALRMILYAAGMIYFFIGVAIIADVFMASIEKVTSRRRQVRRAEDGRPVTEKVWNETVATLTLMALGSSAPEIFLAVVDIVKKKFHFGDLGPSTIVGSAAFNLLMIVGVCVCVIPSDEVRVVKNLPALYITAVFSIFAYLWVAFVLSGHTPQRVEIWEGLVTFLMLPVLVWMSYKVDKGDADGVLRRLGLPSVASLESEEAECAGENKLFFPVETVVVEGRAEAQVLSVTALRLGDNPGWVRCNYHTEAMSAVPGWDYESTEGTLDFKEGENKKEINVDILPKAPWKGSVDFFLILDDAEGDVGVCFEEKDDGGREQAILTVTLGPLPSAAAAGRRGFWSRLDAVVSIDGCRRAKQEWWEQVVGVFFVNGSLEEQRQAVVSDWIAHVLSLPWRMAFMVIPPTCLAGGWACFFSSLGGIAVLTAGISDLAELFGCVLDCPDIVTAISFVALGTSMPDLFASLSAAKEDPTADASIVNVTGSNSVNVFLGLGVPWSIAAIYWEINGPTAKWLADYPGFSEQLGAGKAAFVVEAKNLGFSVLTFCYTSVLALLLLHLRRKWLQAELGGPAAAKVSTSLSLFAYWLGFVVLVSWRVLRYDVMADGELYGVLSAACVLSLLVTALPVYLIRRERVVERRGFAFEEAAETVDRPTAGEPASSTAAEGEGTAMADKAKGASGAGSASGCNYAESVDTSVPSDVITQDAIIFV